MAINNHYVDFILGKLRLYGEMSVRHMFGGIGIFYENKMFAIISEDKLYFKVDETNKYDFENVNMGPFWPPEKSYSMRYYEVPAFVLEDESLMRKWMEKSIHVAFSKNTGKKRKK